jgi:hypothetical protein
MFSELMNSTHPANAFRSIENYDERQHSPADEQKEKVFHDKPESGCKENWCEIHTR